MTRFYKKKTTAMEYDKKRFEGQGGHIIESRENENVLEMLGDLKGKKVLDLGAGTCRYSIQFASKGAEVTALDMSKEMLKIGKEKAKQKGVEDKITFLQGNALKTGYEDGEFDIVTALRLFHLVSDTEGLISEMTRVTNDRVLLDFFNLYSLRMFYNKLLPMDSRLIRKKKLVKMLEKKGFYNIELKRDFLMPYGFYRFSPRPFPILYNKIDKTIGKTFPFKRFSSVIYLGGRKS